MKKRLFASILAVALLLGLVSPVSTQATGTAGEKVTTVTPNADGKQTFTDKTADPNASYEYIITGNDGSREAFTVGPKPMENTGNALTSGSSNVKYVKTAKADVTTGNYLIVGAHSTDRGWAVKPETNCPWDKSHVSQFTTGDEITGTYTALEWTITKQSNGKYKIQKPNTNEYMKINQKSSEATGAVKLDSNTDRTELSINAGVVNVYPKSVTISGPATNGTGYLNKRGNDYVGTYDYGSNDQGSCFELFKRTEQTGSTLDLSGLKALVEQSAHYTEANYTPESWNALQNAKTAANALIANHGTIYTEQNKAEGDQKLYKANEAYTILWNAILNLKPNVTLNPDKTVQADQVAVPSIVWQRTLEYKHNNSNMGAIKTNVRHLEQNNFQKISWNWSQVSDLTTDPRMSVWDYNTDNQYSDAAKHANITAATWAKGTSDWQVSTVRKFSGEFIWPAGYDLDDTAKFVSVNDKNYQAIYDKINGDLSLKKRYGDATVMPINDDMYVVIYKDGDAPTGVNKNFTDHLVYWTGTSGKGRWSDTIRDADWGRETPATYEDVAAMPAYHGKMPNVQDINYNNNFNYESVPNNVLTHTDGWYTMANTSAVMSRLEALYPRENLENKKMHIDIYCFNNEHSGGMDQLELKFVKKKATSAKVMVNYFLDTVSIDTYLGSSTQTNVPDGTQIELQPGTNPNELNYKLAEAKTKAGNKYLINDGVQQGVVPYVVVVGNNNYINVVYTRKTENISRYTYDFGITNEYNHKLVHNTNVTSVTLESKSNNLKARYDQDTRQCKITYTPPKALRQQVMGILTVNYTENGQARTYEETIYVYPASNVLYEETFLTPAQGSKWNKVTTGAVQGSVGDNESTVYGYAQVYDKENPDSVTYKATVTASDRKTGAITTQFGGTGFDLIGTCGPTTGTLAVSVKNHRTQKVVKSYVIDTKFLDTTYGPIQHVPFLHCQGLPNGTYDVTINGAYINYGARGGAKAMSMNSADTSDRTTGGKDAVSEIYDMLYDMGLTEADIDNVEFVSVEDNMVATTYAVDGADRTATPAAPADMTLELDGLRVYGETTNPYYQDKEKNVVYSNVLDSLNGNISAYLEKDPSAATQPSTPTGGYNKVDYQKHGGPQYEVYLEKNQSVALKGNSDKAICQISLRSVTGKPVTVTISGATTTTKTITSPVEMYYEVTPDTSGIVTIQVKEQTETNPMLAIGNVKVGAGGSLVALAEADYPVVYALLNREVTEPEKTYFVPERFDVKMVSKKVGRKTKVTITVESSKDVEYITVNGKKVKASNDTTTIKGFLQNLFDKFTGKTENADVRKFVFTKRYTAKQLNDLKHEIISYNKDRLASKPVIAEEVSK